MWRRRNSCKNANPASKVAVTSERCSSAHTDPLLKGQWSILRRIVQRNSWSFDSKSVPLLLRLLRFEIVPTNLPSSDSRTSLRFDIPGDQSIPNGIVDSF